MENTQAKDEEKFQALMCSSFQMGLQKPIDVRKANHSVLRKHMM